jgi:hypothetical protein
MSRVFNPLTYVAIPDVLLNSFRELGEGVRPYDAFNGFLNPYIASG